VKLIERIARGSERSTGITSLDDMVEWFQLNGIGYPVRGHQSGPTETLPHDFESYVSVALKNNGVVFACVAARVMLFSEATFKFRQLSDGNIFGTTDLGPLNNPGPSMTTQEMLGLMELDASFAGNSYWVRDGAGVRRLRPDWVGIVSGSPQRGSRTTDLLGYTYSDGGPGEGDLETFTADEVAHYSPFRDPTSAHLGMSWITPIVREVQADSAFTKHRLSVAKEGGVHTFAVQYPPLSADQFAEAVKSFRQAYEGPQNSGKSIHIGGGADITPLQMDLRSMDFKGVQAGGETRIAAAARVPAVIAGISEGLAGSSLNQGNYQMARRQFGDLFARPAWRSACGALEKLVRLPAGSVLWWDESDIGFLREDQKDAAEVVARKAEAMRQLVDAGYTAESVAAAVDGADLSLLEHSGLFSVQLQAPGASQPDPARALQEAIRSLPAPRTPDVNVTLPAIDARTTVDMPMTVESPTITIDQQAPEFRVNVEPAQVTVDAAPPAEVTVNMPESRRSVKTVERDDAGNITAIVEEEQDG